MMVPAPCSDNFARDNFGTKVERILLDLCTRHHPDTIVKNLAWRDTFGALVQLEVAMIVGYSKRHHPKTLLDKIAGDT